MSQLRGSDVVSIQSTAEFDDLDHLPLISRRKLLLASTRTSATRIHAVVENEEEDYECLLSLPSVSSVGRGMDQQSVLKQSPDSEAPSGVTSEVCGSQILKTSVADDPYLQKTPCGEVMDTSMPTCSDLITYIGLSTDDDGLERVDGSVCPSYKNTVLLDVSAKLKVEISDDNVLRTVGNGVNEFVGVDALEDKVNTNYPDASADDDLDHILLKERLWMLLERRGLQMGKQAVEDSAAGFSEDLMDPCGVRIKEEAQSVDVDASIIGSDSNEVLERKNSKDGVSSVNAASNTSSGESTLTANQYSEVPDKSLVLEAPKSRKCIGKCDMVCPSERPFVESKSCNVQCDVQHRSSGMHALTLQTFHDVKVEPVENGELNYSEKNASSTSSIKTQVKKEMEIPNEPDEDGVDHMRLQDRMKMQTLREDSELDFSSDVVYLSKTVHPSLQYPEPDKSIRMGQPRKRKKTATDKVETALEEDAPGLLQVLLDQGVSVDEIKLYGEPEGEDLIDETFCEEGFSELEAVMSKLFFQRNSVLKFASIRCAKDSKPSYCLGCLFSLVEQARYLQFRKWPVEWGWCRDLQSFIFVFKRHNRIVLERPEYGYATYFFELINSLPIDWQIKRLVTAMKLTNCGRVNIIENKSLLVGEDVTEGEAKVLIGFGWAPNTGLGTMLNYCDRVFHDRKNEKNISEWRSKISKLLIDGYNGGTIVSTNIADDVIKCRYADSPQFKLEL